MRSTLERTRRVAAGLLGAVTLAVTAASCASAATPSTSTSTSPFRPSAISSSRCAENRAAGTISYVSPFGFGPIPGILELFAAKQLGYFADVCENVSIITNSYTANQLVSADRAQFTSEGSAADTLVSIASGAHFTSLATLADASDYVLLTHPTTTNLTQLEGKKLAYHAPMPVVIEEMLAKAKVDLKKVTLINDTTYNPTLLPKGTYDALQAYQVNEPLTLEAAHLKFKEWLPSTFGVSGTFNTIVVNSTFLAKHPTAAADFLRAELEALTYCESHVAQCVGYEAAAAKATGGSFDSAHATAEWNASVALMKGHSLAGKGLGVQTVAEWQPEATALQTFKVVKSVPALASVVNTSVIDSLYRGEQLVWPAP